MRNRLSSLRRSCWMAGAILISSASFAALWDAQITVGRAANSPTLTVKYDGAFAQLVELRVNGESVATRPLDGSKNAGETNFTLTLSDLKEGDNDIEIRLFDKTGKMISSQKSKITTDASDKGPVYVIGAKQGATVSGPVEIKVGFGKEFKSTFVSFFVDSNFKSMSNFPPFSYVWDTSKEANGWHEIEAWVVDETTTTYKSKKIRVFVNNNGGRTERKGLGGGEYATSKAAPAGTVSGEVGLKQNQVEGAKAAAGAAATVPSTKVVQTKVIDTKPITPGTKTNVDTTLAGTKAVPAGQSVVMGTQQMTPTGTRVATTTTPTVPKLSSLPIVPSTTGLISISKGQRLTGITTFSVLLNNRYVEFDVAPRVDDGIPMTPFRHLIEKGGGLVDWSATDKSVSANAEGRNIWFRVGDSNARINDMIVSLELAPYIDKGRTIVPLSFIKDALKVNIDFDKATGHVLITNKK